MRSGLDFDWIFFIEIFEIKSKSSLTLLFLRRGLLWLRQNRKAPSFAKGGWEGFAFDVKT